MKTKRNFKHHWEVNNLFIYYRKQWKGSSNAEGVIKTCSNLRRGGCTLEMPSLFQRDC